MGAYQGAQASGDIQVNIFPFIALAAVGIAKGAAAIAAKAAIAKGVGMLAAKVFKPSSFMFYSSLKFPLFFRVVLCSPRRE